MKCTDIPIIGLSLSIKISIIKFGYFRKLSVKIHNQTQVR